MITDTEFQIKSFKTRFAELQARTKDELKSMKRTVGTVNVKLLKALPARIEKEYNKYVKLKRSGKQSNLDELFEDLDDFCWNFLEFDLLQFVINSNNCHAVLKNAMDQYAREVEHFKHCTTASSFIKQGQPLIMKKSLKRGYKRLKTKHAVNPDEFVIAEIDRFRKDVWSSDANLSDCAFHLFSIASGSVQVELAIPEEFSYPLVVFFCSEEGKELLLRHHIYEIFIDDEPINPSVKKLIFTTMSMYLHVFDLIRRLNIIVCTTKYLESYIIATFPCTMALVGIICLRVPFHP